MLDSHVPSKLRGPDLINQDPTLNEIVYEYKRYLMRNSSLEPN